MLLCLDAKVLQVEVTIGMNLDSDNFQASHSSRLMSFCENKKAEIERKRHTAGFVP